MSVQEKLFGTAAVMAARNPLVPKGAVAAESDTGVVKVGDGATRYNSLSTALNGTYASLNPAVSSYTYNGDGTVATETVAGVTTTYTYNADGTVATSTRAGVTRTYTYNADATLASVA